MEHVENEYKELSLKYTLAMRKLECEIKNLIDAYTNNKKSSLVDHSKSRIKEFDSAFEKLERKGFEKTPENLEEYITDMVGYRIVCPFISDVYTIVNIIKSSKLFEIRDEDDYIQKPKESGYQSYHLDVSVPIELKQEMIYVPCEIQIRTMAMDLWATLDHKLRYKLSEDIETQLMPEFRARALELRRFDNRMQMLTDEVSELKEEEEQPKQFIKR